MPEPDPKRRKILDDSDASPTPAQTPAPPSTTNEWQKLISGKFTPNQTPHSVITSPFTTSPFNPTPASTDGDGFAMPTPRLPSTRTPSKKPETPDFIKQAMRDCRNPISCKAGCNCAPTSTIPTSTASNMSTTSNLSFVDSTAPPPVPHSTIVSDSTRVSTPFTPTDGLVNVNSIPLNFRKLIITAYQVYEEETLLSIEGKTMKSHLNTMLDGCKQKTGAKGDKLVIKLKELLDYIPKSYHDWERSSMQKMFHRNCKYALSYSF